MRDPGPSNVSRTMIAVSITVFAITSLPVVAPAQQPKRPANKPVHHGTVITRKTSPAKHAASLIRQMELPDRRSVAWRGILSIGAPAAKPLALATKDPRPEVHMRAFMLLSMLRRDGEQALPILDEHIAGDDESLRYAAQWAKGHIEFRGKLLTDWSKHTVVHLNEDHVAVNTIKGLKGPWHAEPCGDGNTLVSEYGAGRVRVLDKEGKALWEFKDCKNPYHAQRLPTGNTLISDASNERVIEVDLKGKIVWEKKGLQRPVAAMRLPDGHTLIVENRLGVCELDASGEEILRHKVGGNPIRAQRLLNGNTLVTSHGDNKVYELDLDGKNAREPIAAPKAQVALRRRDGHTVISSTKAWFELDAKGHEIWRMPGSYATGVYW